MNLLLALLLAFVATLAHAERVAGAVAVVIDGDTVLFKPDRYAQKSRAFLKVRLAGIDAPESDQPGGEAATRALKALALGRHAHIDTVATDVYGRTVGVLEIDGASVNAELVRRGFAWATAWHGVAPLREVAAEARQARRGLWQDAEAIPPWQWRRGVR
ncbi:MAG: thermonuclease family protein [Thiobacillus sp.]|nr:thermonuclease family protein [Thiobacillus sp.]